MAKRKYNRARELEAAAKRSYSMRKRMGDSLVDDMTKEQYVKMYKEYQDYKRVRRRHQGDVMHKEASIERFKQLYDEAADAHVKQEGLGEELANDDLILTKEQMKELNQKYGFSKQMNRGNYTRTKGIDGYQLHDIIKRAIDDGVFASQDVDDILY